MMASRGMGAINPDKMPSGKRKARRDSTDFTQYAAGGITDALPSAPAPAAKAPKAKRKLGQQPGTPSPFAGLR